MNPIYGSCLCGAIQYEAAGEPYNVTHCHCTDCRRSNAAAFVTWASFKRCDFRFTEGEPKQIEWAGRTRTFCANCGTHLTFQSDAAEIDVTVCTFSDPTLAIPADHTWTEDQIPWATSNDNLPRHHQRRA